MSTADANTENGKSNEKKDDLTSQYQIRPAIGKSFPISSVREIINEVLLQVLDGMFQILNHPNHHRNKLNRLFSF